MTFVLFLHIAAAIFFVGPLAIVTATAPRVIRGGEGQLPALRLLNSMTRIYGAGSLLVFLLGLWLVPLSGRGFGEFWLSASMTLYVVAIALTYLLTERDQRKAVKRLETADAHVIVNAGRIAGVSMAVGVIWLAILLLMIYQPGRP